MKRFAFDIGTNSMGWTVLEPNADDSKVKILDMGVRIFNDGREPGKSGQPGDPLNQTRRQKRALRRILERRKRRKHAMYRFLEANGYVPSDRDSYRQWVQLDPYRLRAEALERPLNPLELGRMLMQLSSRRGFKSNRKTDAKKESSEFKEKINALEKQLAGRTLGQYLWEVKKSIDERFHLPSDTKLKLVRDRLRFRPGTALYANRAMYEFEFKEIQKHQEIHHPGFDWEKAFRIVFFQRPLKRPERGACTFYPSEYRAYLKQPSAQMFKALQDINNLSYMTDREYELTVEQKEAIFNELQKRGKLEFAKIRALLLLPDDAVFNLEKGAKDKLEGFSTDIEFSKYIANWREIDLATRDALVESFILEDDEATIKKFTDEGVAKEEIVKALEKIDLPVGVGSLSARFMRECSAIMLNRWIRYDEAVEAMGLDHSKPNANRSYDRLPYYGEVLSYTTVTAPKTVSSEKPKSLSQEQIFGRISNPTVHIALNQLQKLCNALIDRFGKPDEVAVELATELKFGREKIKQRIQEQRKNRDENSRISQEICRILGQPEDSKISGMDILKYRLWEELGANSAGRYCIYCGKPISAHQLFNGDAEIEHILPFSRTLKNNRNNLTIAHKWCNALKGNRTPFEAFAENPLDYSWADIETRVQDVFRYNFAKKNAFLKTDLEEALMNESSFLESQITDTAFIAKAAKEYLSCIVPPQKIMVTPGRLTSLLRAKWGLNSILSSAYDEKNRADHRHHAIDAIVIGLTTRSTLQRFATANAHGAAEKIMPPSFPIDRNWLEKRLASMLISYKPDHGIGGALFDETAYGFKVDPANPDRKPSEYYVRKPIGSLTWNIVDNGDILNNWARETIHDFLCEKQLSSKNSDNKKLSLAMQELSKISGIQSVKIRAKNAEGYKILLAGTNGRQGHKAYQKGDILCVDIWRIPKKSKKGFEFKGIYTSRADAHANGGIIVKHRPHPAAKWLMRLYKNDIIILGLGGQKIFSRIAGFSTTDNRIDIRPIYAANSVDEWIDQTSGKFKVPFWKKINREHNYYSLNTIFNYCKEVEIKHVNISIDGRLLCRK